MARPRKVPKVLTNDFVISLKMGNEVTTSHGATALEALANFPTPHKIFLKGILTISYGDKSRELLLQPVRIKRLFYPVSRELMAKQLTMLVS